MSVERITALERCTSRHEERINNLEKWQDTQNGSLQRIEQKIDGLIHWMMRTVVVAGLSLLTALVILLLGRL